MTELVAEFEKRYPRGATVRAALQQAAEEFSVTVLFGPSGCGKTTILRCLAGLERPEEGHIRLGTQTWYDARRDVCLPPQQRGIGYLFQEYALFPHLSVERNIGYAVAGSRRQRQGVVAGLLARFQLTGLGERLPSQLSGGQQQRVALARAVARRPRLLLLDEPLSALDSPTRDELRRELRGILRSIGVPAVIVTHDAMEAITLADRVLILHQGRVRQSGTVEDVFSRPVDPEVARIVGMDTVARGTVEQVQNGLATVQVGSARLLALAPDEPAGSVHVCIRAEDVILQREPSPASSIRNQLQARVVSWTPEGALIRVLLDCGFTLAALITRTAREELRLQPGETVVALFKAAAVRLMAAQ